MARDRSMVSQSGRQYSRHSFDRFGDDLSELILSFLTFEDKIRYECVSKQFQRLIYNKQTELIARECCELEDLQNSCLSLFGKTINCNQLKTLLKKCPNMKSIEIQSPTNDSILQVLTDCCPRLQSISVCLFDPNNIPFNQFCGWRLNPNLKSFRLLSPRDDKMRQLLPSVSDNRKFRENNSKLINKMIDDLPPYLEKISFESLLLSMDYTDNYFSSFNRLVDRYEQRITELGFSIDGFCNSSVIEVTKQLSRLTRLKYLRLKNFWSSSLTVLTQIGTNCPNVETLSMTVSGISATNYVSTFKSLQELDINLSDRQLSPIQTTQSLSTLKKLVITCGPIDTQFLVNIFDLAPNLKVLEIRTKNHFTNEHLLRMPMNLSLKRIVLNQYHDQTSIDDSGVCHLLEHCLHLRQLVMNFEPKITETTTDKMFEFALIRPKERISFYGVPKTLINNDVILKNLTISV